MTRKEEQVRKAMLHYLEGSIHPEELEVLNQVVENDPEARRDLAELMLQDALLTKVSEESEFFELDEPAPTASSSTSFRTSRIMKITRRNPVCEPAAVQTFRGRLVTAAAAILFTVSVAFAVKQMQPAGHSEPVTTVMPIVPVAPVATPLPEEHPAEPPVKATVAAPAEPAPAPVKPKAPAAKPKTATVKKDVPDSKPTTTTTVPDGFLTLPSPGKLPPPSPSKPAPKLPPKPPPPQK